MLSPLKLAERSLFDERNEQERSNAVVEANSLVKLFWEFFCYNFD